MRNKLLAVLSIVMLLCGVFTVKIIGVEVEFDNIAYSEQDMDAISGIAYPVNFAVYDANQNKLNGISINYSYVWQNEYGFDIHISNETYRAIRADREKYRLYVKYSNDVTVDHGPLYRNAYQKEESEDKIMKYSPEGANYKELYYVIIERDIYDVQISFDNKTLLLNDYSEDNGKVIWTQNFRQNSDNTVNAFYHYIADQNNDFTLTFKKKSDNSVVSYTRNSFTVSDNGKMYLEYTVDGESGTIILENNGGSGGGSGYEYDSDKSDVTVLIDKDDQGRYTVNAYKGETLINTIYGDTPSARNALIGAVNYLQGYVKSKVLLNTDLIWDTNIDNDNDIELDHQYIKGWQIDYNNPENPDNGLDIDLNGHNINGFRLSVPGSWAFIYLNNTNKNNTSNITFNSGDPALSNSGNVFLLGKVQVLNSDGSGIVIFKEAEKTYIGKDAIVDAKTGVSFVSNTDVVEDDLTCSLTVLGKINAALTGISFNLIDNNTKHKYFIHLEGNDDSHPVITSSGTGISVIGKPEVILVNCEINAVKALEVGGGIYTVGSSKIKSTNGPLFSIETNSEDSRETSITIKADSGVELVATDYIVSATADNSMIKEISFYAEDSEVENGFIQYEEGLVNGIGADKVDVRGGCYSKDDIGNYLVDAALSVVPSTKYQGFYTVVIPDSTVEVTDYETLKAALQSNIVTTINVMNNITGSIDIVFDCKVSKRINLNGKTISGFALNAITNEVKQSGDENSLTVNDGILYNSNGDALIIDGPRTFLNKVTVDSPNNNAILLKNGDFNTDENTVISGKQGIIIDENKEKEGHAVSINMNGTKVNTVGSAFKVINTTDDHHTYINLKKCNITVTSDENPILDIDNNAVIEIDASYLSGGSCGVDFDNTKIKKVGENFYSRLRIINETNIISKKGLHLAKEVEFESYDTIIQAVNNVIEAYDETHILIASGYYSSENGNIIFLEGGESRIEERTILSGFYSHFINDYIVNGIRDNFRYVCEQVSNTGVYKFRVMKMFGNGVFFNPQYIGSFDETYFTREIDTDIDLVGRSLKDLDLGEAVILSVEDARYDEGIDSFPGGDYADYFDIYLNRKTEQIEEADGYVVIKISYENADNLKIYHKHGNAVYQIKKVAPAYGKSMIEECYYVENGAIYIVVKKFSLFGIQDNGSAVPYDNRTVTPTYTIPKTGIE